MDAQEMRAFSVACECLEKKFRYLAESGEAEMPFNPMEVAESLSLAANDFRPGPLVVPSK